MLAGEKGNFFVVFALEGELLFCLLVIFNSKGLDVLVYLRNEGLLPSSLFLRENNLLISHFSARREQHRDQLYEIIPSPASCIAQEPPAFYMALFANYNPK